MSEAKLQKWVFDYIKYLGPDVAWAYHPVDAVMIGLPDIIGCILGQFFAIELKSDVGAPTAIQMHTLSAIRAVGGKTLLTASLNDAKQFIREIFHERRLGRKLTTSGSDKPAVQAPRRIVRPVPKPTPTDSIRARRRANLDDAGGTKSTRGRKHKVGTDARRRAVSRG